jgi:alpha-beta hydrolase superfamily lysophospholipase
MKKKAHKSRRGQILKEMRAEYDFSGGVRGKHAARYAAGTNVVVLDPDVVEAFPNAAAVNEALRALARIMDRRRKRAARTHKSA